MDSTAELEVIQQFLLGGVIENYISFAILAALIYDIGISPTFLRHAVF